MNAEKPHLSAESRNKEISEEEKKREVAKQLEFSHEKQLLLKRIEKNKQLSYLKSLVERGLITLPTAQHIIEGDNLDATEIKDIFEKIDELEEMHDIEEILPKRLRLTKEEYLSALEDPILRDKAVQKLDASLDYLRLSSKPAFAGILSFFSSLMHSFSAGNSRVVQIQGDIIDIKRSIEASEKLANTQKAV